MRDIPHLQYLTRSADGSKWYSGERPLTALPLSRLFQGILNFQFGSEFTGQARSRSSKH
jgi:hypothetical protein